MIFLFWDKPNDQPEILGEDGEFYMYSEDDVMVNRSNGEEGRYWTKLNKMQDRTPLNEWERFEFFSEIDNAWIPWEDATQEQVEQVEQVHQAANDPDWNDRV